MLTVLHAGLVVANVLLSTARQNGRPAPRLETATAAHVRPLDPLSRALLADGAARSPVLSGLLADLNRASGLIVYVTTRATELATKGALRFMTHDQWFTYVIVCIDPRQGHDDRIAVLAHELRHATEVASAAAWLTSEADLRRLYRHIGFDHARGLESEAALAAQNAVRRDLTHSTHR